MHTWGVHPLRGRVLSVLPVRVITYFNTQKSHVAPFLIFSSRVIRPSDRGFNPFPAKKIGLLTQFLQITVSQRDLANKKRSFSSILLLQSLDQRLEFE